MTDKNSISFQPKLQNHQFKDIEGQRFTRWVVLGYAGQNERKASLWYCRCDCGTVRIVKSNDLLSNKSKSCGCLQHEITAERNYKHGLATAPEHQIWTQMKVRCNNPKNKGYKNYGGRGIKVCERWQKSFADFISDMGQRPSPNHSIERIDNDGDYEPQNCKWATYTEQANNTRNNHFLTFNGETLTINQWARKLGIDRRVLTSRLIRGWSVERVLGEKLHKIRKRNSQGRFS
jgi:hypothetical protein